MKKRGRYFPSSHREALTSNFRVSVKTQVPRNWVRVPRPGRKKKLSIISFLESVHKISEGFLTYNDRKDINDHQCSIEVIQFYSDYLAVHLDASKNRLLKEYKKNTKSKKSPGPASPAPWHKPLWLLLLLLTLLTPKTLESDPITFSMRKTPHLRQQTTTTWSLPKIDLLK